MIVKHAAMGIENNNCIIQGCCVNLQLAHKKEYKIDDLVQCVKSNCIYNIHRRLSVSQIQSLLSIIFLDSVVFFWPWNKISVTLAQMLRESIRHAFINALFTDFALGQGRQCHGLY